MSETSAQHLVTRWWYEVLGEGRLELIDELVADTFISHTLDGTRVRTRAQLKRDLVSFQRTLRGSATSIDDQCVSGDAVWSRITTRAADLSTGEMITITWLTVSRVVDSRLRESWVLHAPGVDWSSKDWSAATPHSGTT
jgi:hypothetical protein